MDRINNNNILINKDTWPIRSLQKKGSLKIFLTKFILSMPKKIESVIRLKGDRIKYWINVPKDEKIYSLTAYKH